MIVMRAMNVENAQGIDKAPSGSLAEALRRRIGRADLSWRKPLRRAISVAETEFSGLLKQAPHVLQLAFAVETILCKGIGFGLPAGSAIKQLELEEKLCAAGVPWEDIQMVESKIAKALNPHR
ncbi:MAG: hypothetical protein NUV78_02530 [Candidatus Zambryskibacteria bacterium]|nr:hypothetical protein [Candidatus Zambryskibacteria bacterium]